jgi:chromosome segregation ATPase
MDWLSFIVGMLAGWLIEWLVDLLFWRRSYQALYRENVELRSNLAEKEKMIQQLQGRAVGDDECRKRLAEAEAALEALRATVFTAENKIEELTDRLHAVRARRASA